MYRKCFSRECIVCVTATSGIQYSCPLLEPFALLFLFFDDAEQSDFEDIIEDVSESVSDTFAEGADIVNGVGHGMSVSVSIQSSEIGLSMLEDATETSDTNCRTLEIVSLLPEHNIQVVSKTCLMLHDAYHLLSVPCRLLLVRQKVKIYR